MDVSSILLGGKPPRPPTSINLPSRLQAKFNSCSTGNDSEIVFLPLKFFFIYNLISRSSIPSFNSFSENNYTKTSQLLYCKLATLSFASLELALETVGINQHSKFEILSYNNFSENSYTKNVIAFILRARYALFRFARNSSLNLHQKQQTSICTQNFKSLATIVSLKIATQKTSQLLYCELATLCFASLVTHL